MPDARYNIPPEEETMPGAPDLKPVLTFLSSLQKNNNKAWFEQNRPAYEKAKGEFEDLVDELILGLGAIEDMKGVAAKDCVMRIYRDIRFSKDKSPYKIAMGASIGPGGRQAWRHNYFLHLEPHNRSIVAGGLHEPESAQINNFRAAIARDSRKFKAIFADKLFKQYFGEVGGEKLKTAPQGYDRDHPEIELLRLKEVVAVHNLSDEMVLSPGFAAHMIKACTAMKPFLDYLSSVLA
jgi:uncharacterized protein (TIGR02453 family)